MHIHRLQTVDAFIAFDFDDVEFSAGGTRMAPDVTEEEAALLARAMTYKFAVLGRQAGGAKGAIRARPEDRDDAMARYLAEVKPMVDSGRFSTGSDLGTFDSDFDPIRDPSRPRGPMSAHVDGVAMEDLVTGFGVATAAEAALSGLEGKTVAIEGFGKVGGGVGREAVRRGGTVVAVSTLRGCVADPGGLDVELLWKVRAEHGDDFVSHLDLPTLPASQLFGVDADVLVPGARTGVIDADVASRVGASVVVPAANVPYTRDGLAVLVERGIAAHADFVCNAGAVIGFTTRGATTTDEIFEAVERQVTELVTATRDHPEGPFAGAREIAEDYLRSWRGDRLPEGPPVA